MLGAWSRLLIDLNRGADDPTLVMKLSDGSIIPGNRTLDAAELAHRIAAFHAPYHDRVTARSPGLKRGVRYQCSYRCTASRPSGKRVPRPWEVGVLWDRDGRLARPLMARLAEAGFVVGDNEPYAGALEGDTLNRHGTKRGLPHVLIEMRQDLIAEPEAARAFAGRLKPILGAALSDMGPATIQLPPYRR